LSTGAALKSGSGVEFSANTVVLGAGAKFTGDAMHNSFDLLGRLFNQTNKIIVFLLTCYLHKFLPQNLTLS
jgi:hypothetical protein